MENKINSKSLLSTLWIFVLFNMIVRDLHEFLNQGYIQKLMALNLPEETMLLYGVVLEIPILMTVLSRILNNSINKWMNIIASAIAMLGAISTLPTADMDDIFFTIVNSLALVAIIYTAWKLPHQKDGGSFEMI